MRTPASKPVSSLWGSAPALLPAARLGPPTRPALSGQGSRLSRNWAERAEYRSLSFQWEAHLPPPSGPEPELPSPTACTLVCSALLCPHLEGPTISVSREFWWSSGQPHAVLDGSWQWVHAWDGSMITPLSRLGGRLPLSPPQARGSRCAGTTDRALTDRGLVLSLVRLLPRTKPSGRLPCSPRNPGKLPAPSWSSGVRPGGRQAPTGGWPCCLKTRRGRKGEHRTDKGGLTAAPWVCPPSPPPSLEGPCCGAGVSAQGQAPTLQAPGRYTFLPTPFSFSPTSPPPWPPLLCSSPLQGFAHLGRAQKDPRGEVIWPLVPEQNPRPDLPVPSGLAEGGAWCLGRKPRVVLGPWLQGPGEGGEGRVAGQRFQGPACTLLLASLLASSGRRGGWGGWGQGHDHCPAPWALACRGLGGRAPPRSSLSHLNPGSETGSDRTKGPLSWHRALRPRRSCPEPTAAVLAGPSRRGRAHWHLGTWPFPPHPRGQPAQGPSGRCCPAPGFRFPANPSQGSPQTPEPGSSKETGADRARAEGGRVCVRVRVRTHACACPLPGSVRPVLGCAGTCPGSSPLPLPPQPSRPGIHPLLHRLPGSSPPFPAWVLSPLDCANLSAA